jgi:hypothetical protein
MNHFIDHIRDKLQKIVKAKHYKSYSLKAHILYSCPDFNSNMKVAFWWTSVLALLNLNANRKCKTETKDIHFILMVNLNVNMKCTTETKDVLTASKAKTII